jgi:hypothetical protein
LKRLDVFLHRENNDRLLVGQLGESDHRIFFEYDPAFLTDPLWLSPFKLPPEPGLHEHRDLGFGPLFGLFNDSLPDGWALLLFQWLEYMRHLQKDYPYLYSLAVRTNPFDAEVSVIVRS